MINWANLEAKKSELADMFSRNDPFKYMIIEDSLEPAFAEEIEAGYEKALSHKDPHTAKNHKDVLRKMGSADLNLMTKVQVEFFSKINSPDFIKFLEDVTEISPIYEDEGLKGGGLHQSIRGGFLNVHTDFNFHPKNNETSEHSFHGHPVPLDCPENVSRRSLAVYYYSQWPKGVEKRSNTNYVLTAGQRKEVMAKMESVMQERDISTWKEMLPFIPDIQPSHIKKLFAEL